MNLQDWHSYNNTSKKKTYTFEQFDFIQSCLSVMGSTLYHFEGYKTLGPKTGSSSIDFILHLTFKHLSDDTKTLHDKNNAGNYELITFL
jgi:hypothetical protein